MGLGADSFGHAATLHGECYSTQRSGAAKVGKNTTIWPYGSVLEPGGHPWVTAGVRESMVRVTCACMSPETPVLRTVVSIATRSIGVLPSASR